MQLTEEKQHLFHSAAFRTQITNHFRKEPRRDEAAAWAKHQAELRARSSLRVNNIAYTSCRGGPNGAAGAGLGENMSIARKSNL